MSARFVVREVEGWEVKASSGAARGVPGLSVVVLDRPFCYQRVQEFRSEQPGGMRPGPTGKLVPVRLGHDGARTSAQALCDRLNAEHETTGASGATKKA